MKSLPTRLQLASEVPMKIFRQGERSFLGYQIYYDTRTATYLDKDLNPYFNESASVYLESDVIAQLLEAGVHREADYFGVFSWKLRMKVGTDADSLYRNMAADGFQSDVYTFNFYRSGTNVWEHSPTLPVALLAQPAQTIFAKLGFTFSLAELPTLPIYQNHFVCRSSIYELFYKELLGPALKLLRSQEDAELQAQLEQDSQYPYERHLRPRVRQIFGQDYYTLHPFLVERFFPTWLALRGPELRLKTHVVPSPFRPVAGPFSD